MEYQDVHKTAEIWGVSDRLVQRLCAEGRIPNARKLGGSWAIPVNALKPQDPRKLVEGISDLLGVAEDAVGAAGADPLKPVVFFKFMPLLNTPFEPGCCKSAIENLEDPDMRRIAEAEHCYFIGQAEEAARISGDFLDNPDLAVRLSACLVYAYANLPLGNVNRSYYALTELRIALQEDLSESSEINYIVGAFTAYVASVLLHLPLPDDLPSADEFFDLLPPGLKLFALYVRAHQLYLQGDYSRSLGLAEAALLMRDRIYPISEIYLHLVAVMDCVSLKRIDDARNHLLSAWDLGRPDGLIEPFGEHHGLLGGMLESVIKKEWPEDFKSIIDITYRFSAGWRRVHNPVANETVADNLTTTEFAVSMLAARGWTNQEIGNHLGISANTVKSYLSSSFRKLGISRRQDLGKYMLR